jgi:hypothetical protein
MLGVLVITFGKNAVAGRSGIASQRQVFLPHLTDITPDLGLWSVTVYDPIAGRRAAPAGRPPTP